MTFPRTAARLAQDGLGGPVAQLFGVGALLSAWLGWAALAPLDVEVRTDLARIEVAERAHPVSAEVAGRVVDCRLVLGQAVSAGDVLVELDAEVPRLRLAEVEARLAANREVLAGMDRLRDAQSAVLDRLRVAGRAAVDETEVRASGAAVAARFASLNADQVGELSRRGVAAELDAVRTRAEADGGELAARAAALASKRAAADQASQQSERVADLQELEVERARLLVAVSTDEVTVQQLRAEVERRTIVAPSAGRLGWVESVTVGQAVRDGQHLATVVPDGDLQVVATFPARDAIGRIAPGQRASLRLDAFPWTRYGSVPAVVTRIGTEPVDGAIRVEARILDGGTAPRAHGLEGSLAVAVEQATPLGLMLRAVGGRPGSEP